MVLSTYYLIKNLVFWFISVLVLTKFINNSIVIVNTMYDVSIPLLDNTYLSIVLGVILIGMNISIYCILRKHYNEYIHCEPLDSLGSFSVKVALVCILLLAISYSILRLSN